ncbi:aspartate aminotransferase family protein [Salaquimonas pukyongi]|uniref:aspartate aminotransferase family protein n=1 Tax=Salaquimonas pukyongi TaxID=2712698 RepID=UPI00096BC3FB|nr:aspartate aminotransferase family protein [Salaquimonas pukyongi]
MNVNLSTADLRQKDAAHHFHPFTDHKTLGLDERRVMVRADGVWMWDSDGNRIMDGMAGLWCVNVGHGRQEIIEAVRSQMSELSYYNTFFKTTTLPAIELAEMLAEITPPQFKMSFFGGSGSDGNDTVVRMVRTYWQMLGKPEKKIILSRVNAYHGSTVAAAALGGMAGMHAQGGVIGDIDHASQPFWFGEGQDMTPEEFGLQAARSLEAKIDELGEENIAAFIAEPIQGAGGVIVPPDSYWPEIKRILDERDILFISDEVICGFGRTGSWFGCQTYGTEPDMMTMAKGLSSGYLPIGAVSISDKIADVFHTVGGEFFHGYTYSGHPACCAAAIANLKIMQREKLVERCASDIGPYLQEHWKKLGEHPLVGEAVMVGLMGAIELVPDKSEPKKRFEPGGEVGNIARDHSFKNGLVMRAVRDRLIICPPLTLTHAEADELAAMATKSLDDTLDDLKKQGRI